MIFIKKALELDSTNSHFWSVKAFCHCELHEPEKALQSADKAIALKPKSHEGWLVKTRLHLIAGNSEKALQALYITISLNPIGNTSWYNIASLSCALEEKENSLLFLRRAIESDATFKQKAITDEDFKNCLQDEKFKALLK